MTSQDQTNKAYTISQLNPPPEAITGAELIAIVQVVDGVPGTYKIPLTEVPGGGSGVTSLNGETGALTITSADNTVTIASVGSNIDLSVSGPGLAWSAIPGTTQAAAVNNGYITTNVGLTTITLPPTAKVGDRIAVAGAGTGGWVIAQNTGQIIHFGNVPTTAGAGGSIASGNAFDCLEIICTTANTTFVVRSAQGNQVVT